MDDVRKTKGQLIAELESLRQRITQLEASENACRLAEAALIERDARTRAILETAVDGIITIDEKGIVESCNPAAERLFGYTADEVIGQNVKMLMPSPYHEEHDAYLKRYLTTGEKKIIGVGREAAARRKDGTTFPVVLAVSEVRLGDQRMFTGIVHDITERKQAEEDLRKARDELELRVQERTAELSAANEEIKRFAYIVSHDLRAPLVNLKGFAGELHLSCASIQAAMQTVLPHLDERQRSQVTAVLEQDIPEALGFIDASATRMDELIHAILQLSRLGRCELRRESVQMDALVKETLQTLGHQIAERHVQVMVGALPEICADRLAMEQIMGNLLANAVAYLDPARPGTIAVTAQCRPDITAFYVRDNGRGIAAEDIPKIFEPFRRVGKQDVPGEGMGLAYVRTLVRRLGGEIRCQSAVGVGTTFAFTIAQDHAQGETHAA